MYILNYQFFFILFKASIQFSQKQLFFCSSI